MNDTPLDKARKQVSLLIFVIAIGFLIKGNYDAFGWCFVAQLANMAILS